MIIEIKDLPANHNVRTINFAIEFEDGKVQHITQNPGTPSPMNTPDFSNDHTITCDKEARVAEHTDVQVGVQAGVIERPVPETNRPYKEVPAEMQDLEF